MALLLLRNISLHKIPPDFFGILKPTISVIPRSLYTIRLMGTASPRGGHSEESMKPQAQRDFQTEPSCDSPDDSFRREASLAIKGHLCRKWHLSKSDVSRAIEHAPRFVTKMKTLVEATGKVKELKNELNLVKPEVGVYGAAVETLLKEAGTISEVELFLESIGKEEEGTVPAGIELCADRGLVAVTRLLERYGFPRTGIYDLIQKHKFLLKCSESELEKTLKTLEFYGLSREILPPFLHSCPSVLNFDYLNQWRPLFSSLQKYPNRIDIIGKLLNYCAKFGLDPVGPQNYEENVKFLLDHRIGSSYIGRCLEKCPLLFFLNKQTDLEPKIKVLRDAGVKNATIYHVLRKYLNFVTYRTPSLALKIEYLKSIGLTGEDIDQVYFTFPALLAHSIEDKLKPLVTELESLGFTGHHLVKTILHNPYVFSMKVGGELSRCVSLLKNLKCRKPLQDKIYKEGIIAGSRRVKARLEYLIKQGLSHREAFKLLEKEPRIILYDLQSIEEKVNFLISDMGFPVRNLIEVPDYLGVNFYKQILPRYRVIAYLRSKGGLGVEVTLKTMTRLTRNQFYNKYVRPYPDCEKFFVNCIKEEEKQKGR